LTVHFGDQVIESFLVQHLSPYPHLDDAPGGPPWPKTRDFDLLRQPPGGSIYGGFNLILTDFHL